ncbi:hypothetical protein Q764_13110 [Flavobacterium suncheonense GH29-5 = DSM 17707]|uniref:Uncharacterized protein n=1 Tax=Flavobacterium suncheonense GH29-5 = DSM 17707 TaxID=1121899 RepID=A0A0A2M3K1_9FLAO|nr:hypothetical protein Q764_13110 [Flavobacterium suncheonense GH29-5 = DSM 17707]
MFALLLRSEAFSFKLLGIFVNISNKNPRLHKAGGTLHNIFKTIAKKNNQPVTFPFQPYSKIV